MSAFEFFFSLFGLILGLAIATVIGGLSDILRQRDRVPIGWLTPMLALFVLGDLSTLWVNAWTGLSHISVAYGPFFSALIIAGIYFFSASLVFPKTASEWPSLDAYYVSHRRYVVGGVLAANLGLGIVAAASNHGWGAFFHNTFAHSQMTPVWWLALIAMFVFANTRVQLLALTILLFGNLSEVVLFWIHA